MQGLASLQIPQGQEQRQRPEEASQDNVHRLLRTSSYEEHENQSPDCEEGTCQWVLQSSEFQAWSRNNRKGLLWITADHGCGESVLARSLIDRELRASASENRCTCYFFFKNNTEQNDINTALCPLWHQLFAQRPSLLRHALQSWKQNGSRLLAETQELWKCFLAAATDLDSGEVVCVLDGIDECKADCRQDLIGLISDFYLGAPSSSHSAGMQAAVYQQRLKSLLTSRPYEAIRSQFHRVSVSCLRIHIAGEMENKKIGAELYLVCHAKLASLSSKFNLDADAQELLKSRLHRER